MSHNECNLAYFYNYKLQPMIVDAVAIVLLPVLRLMLLWLQLTGHDSRC